MFGRTRTQVAKVAALAVGLAVLASGCAKDAPQTTLEPQGPKAQTIHDLIIPVFGIAAVVFVLILGGALVVALKFRAKDDTDYDDFPEQIHGNFKMEIGWTILPAIVLAIVGAFTVVTIFDLAEKPGPEAVQVEVVGQQWWWEYRYDVDNDGKTDFVTANDLVIPTGRDIALRIKSRDVIHSWWAPALNGKKDAVPGRTHPLSINAPDEGEYIGQCTEFCGLSHAEMRIKVVAISPDAYETWTANQAKPFAEPTDADAVAGWSTFVGQCTTCHRITGLTSPGAEGAASTPFEYPEDENTFSHAVNQVSGAAPNLTHFASRTTFAGAKFDLRLDTKACKALGEDWASTDEGIENCLNRKDLEAWLRNPPAMKAMYPGDVPAPDSRGMPNFNLTEDQINQLVAFLITLK